MPSATLPKAVVDIATPTYLLRQAQPQGGPGDPTYTPDQIRTAYGINSITMPGVTTADGTGQTIAIVDAYNDPNILTDLDTFDNAYSLTTGGPTIFSLYGAASTFLTVYDQNGNVINPASPPSTLPNSATSGVNDWSIEISLDVEWAHATAPGAKIDLIEANSANDSDLVLTAVPTAAKLSGVSVVSMSFSESEFSSETSEDSAFTTPTGHQGVTFFAATGDNGSPGGYPAYSPNVVAVGGTSLLLNSNNTWQSETGWGNGSNSATDGGSGGGTSTVEAEPSYQSGAQSTGFRTIPDVSYDADPDTGVFVVDSFDGSGTAAVGGTSFATPSWAALVAIANQGRVAEGGVTFNTGSSAPQQTQTFLYDLYKSSSYSTYFHDITSGNNGGFSAGPGYDEVTGIGSPITNTLIPVLASFDLPTISPGTLPAGQVGISYSQTVTASNGVGNKTMTISGLPAGLTGTLSANKVVISGTPSVAGTFTVVVTATDAVGDKVAQTYSLTINPGFVFSPTSLPNGFVGVLYPSQTITAGGGDGTATISADHITANPTGLSITLSGGHVSIAGTPTASGTVTFTVTATDTSDPTGVTKSYSFYIDRPVLSFSQQPTNTASGSLMSPAVVVNVVGAISGLPYGNPVFVTLSILSGPSGGAIVGGNPTVAVSGGTATFSGLSFITTGTYILQATVSNTSGGTALGTASSASFQVTASQLVIGAQPPALVGSGLPFGLTVKAEDANGNLASNFNGSVTVSLASQTLVGSLGTAQLGGTVTVIASNGLAVFGNLSLQHLGTYTLQGTSGSLVSLASSSIVVGAGQLVFTTIPASVGSGTNFQVIVKAEDSLGNVDSSFNSTVTLSVKSGPAGALLKLNGSTPVSVAASSGIATFSNLTLDRAGTYTLAASASPPQGTLTGTSSSLVVEPSAIIFLNSTPPASVVSGAAFSVQVEVTDSTGVATGFTGQVTLSAATGPGGLRGTTTVNLVNGIGSFSSVILDHFGNYTLSAAVAGGGPSVISGTVTVTADAFTLISANHVMAGRPATLQIAAVDDLGNVCTNFHSPISVTLTGKPFRGIVLGTMTTSFANGVITVNGLTFENPGAYTFLVTSGSISSTILVQVPGSIGVA